MKKLICLILSVMLTASLFVVTFNPSAAGTPDVNGMFFANFSNSSVPVYDGLKNSKTASLNNDATVSSYKATLVTPTPDKNQDDPIVIRHSSVPKLSVEMENLRYIRYYCYYGSYGMPGYTTYDDRAKLVIKQSDFNLAKECTVYSMDKIVPDEWNYITFDVGEVLNSHILEGGVLPEMEFYPFGNTPSKELSEKDSIAFLQMFLLAKGSTTAQSAVLNGNLVHKYPIYFVPGRAECEGEMETMYVKPGETFILPECEFTREGYEFLNWICSYGAGVYYPGDEYSTSTFSYNGTVGIETGHRYFFANWKPIKSGDEITTHPDIAVAGYSEYWGGLVKPAAQTYAYTYADVYKNYEFDGVNTLRLVFNPDDKDAARVINLDGHQYNKIPLDILHYSYLAIPYYYKTDRDSSPYDPPKWSFLPGNTKALSKSVTISASSGRLKTNQWGVMVFKFDFNKDYTLYKNLNPDSTTTFVNQCHFNPFGTISTVTSKACAYASTMIYGDELYLGNFIFMKDIPKTDLVLEKGYINGYEDGTFRPNESLTNAEAAVLLAKGMGVAMIDDDAYSTSYTDIKSSDYDWCRPYVAYLESKGVLSGGGKFNPSEGIRKSEFTKQLIKAKSGIADNGSDYTGESKVKLLTRAEAVNLINSLYKNKTPSETKTADTLFKDVTKGQWYYSDILTASRDTLAYTDRSGKTQLLDALGKAEKIENTSHGVSEELIEIGDEYLADLEGYTNERIAQIRATESQYSVKDGGKIVYVSSSMGSFDGGDSEDNPLYVKTLNEASDVSLNPGDVMLFRRGDTFRGILNTTAGVTYSAYGVGDKPIFTRSPENGSGTKKWTLEYSDDSGKKIWKYYDESYIDVGGINLFDISGENTVAYKEVPSSIDGKFWVRGYKPGENSAYPDGIEFDYIEQLDHDLEFFHKADSRYSNYNHVNIGTNKAPELGSSTGPVYLRCDKGNPGTLYSQIEFNLRSNCIAVGSNNNVTVDNICIKFFGSHGVGAGNVNNLKVTNCEIGWGGGAIQNYQTAANYSNPGHVVRYGNGIEIYGGCGNYTIDNCYVYQIYDAGITHQVSGHSNGNYLMENVIYTNNVLTDCIYNIEYFLTQNNTKNADGTLPLYERIMDNVLFEGNICRRAGYGWGVQRPDGNVPSNIRGWGTHNLTNKYVIRNNIFDRCVDFKNSTNDFTVSIGSAFETALPYFEDNIFVQVPGRTLLGFGTTSNYGCNINAEALLESFGGVGNKVYFVTDDQAEASTKVQWRN
ncbi:MAG: S-layer homology domain-containing protein [Clostridia bacterium]|nr:S-layer homology domain-containing protein [Clostridia bacterium]